MPNPTKVKKGQREATMGDFLAFDKKARGERAADAKATKLAKGKAANRALVLKRKAANKAAGAKIKAARAAKSAKIPPNPFR